VCRWIARRTLPDWPAKTVLACGYLESLSPREELASFLSQRGECWLDERNYREAVMSFVWAIELDPRRGQHAFQTQQAMQVWHETQKLRLPQSPFYPILDLVYLPVSFSSCRERRNMRSSA
jgi:hypothetical protein